MSPSTRALRGFTIGCLILGVGFALLLHPDIWRVRNSDGLILAPYAAEFEFLARLLMYSGAAMSVLALAFWMAAPARG